MHIDTLTAASLTTTMSLGFSVLALVVAAFSLYLSWTVSQQQTDRVNRYSQISKFNQIQITHHNNRLSRLESALKIGEEPMLFDEENKNSD